MDIQMILGGSYFMILGYWWCIQATKRYQHCKQRRVEFRATITYPCCQSCSRLPVESIVKLICCIVFIIFGLLQSTNFGKTHVQLQNLHYVTIFAFFVLSSVLEIIQVCREKMLIENLDYAVLALTFGVQATLFGVHVPDTTAQEWTVFSLLMISAFSCCVATLSEMKFRDQIYCSLLRSFSLVLLGTWMIHSSLLLSDPILISDANSHHRVVILSMYFTWHCAVNFVTLICIWLLVLKFFDQNKCLCMPVLDYGADNDAVYLQNRVRFDYHMLDRLELEVD